jgi:hypothetical protein
LLLLPPFFTANSSLAFGAKLVEGKNQPLQSFFPEKRGEKDSTTIAHLHSRLTTLGFLAEACVQTLAKTKLALKLLPKTSTVPLGAKTQGNLFAGAETGRRRPATSHPALPVSSTSLTPIDHSNRRFCQRRRVAQVVLFWTSEHRAHDRACVG